MKNILPVLLIVLISNVSYSQTTRQITDQVKKDPQTAERAAKADGNLVNKKIVTDSTLTKASESGCRNRKQKKKSSK